MKLLGLYLITVMSGVALATSNVYAAQENHGVWSVVSAGGSFNKTDTPSPWRYSADLQYRALDPGSAINQSVVNGGAGYRLGEDVTLWMGYGYFSLRTSTGERLHENRFWQQLDWQAYRTSKGTLAVRAKLEERMAEVGDDTSWRLRTLIRYSHRLGKTGKWQATASIEPFFTLNEADWAAETGVTQSRVFIGASRAFTDSLSLEFGYMNQYGFRPGEDLMNHLAVIHVKQRR